MNFIIPPWGGEKVEGRRIIRRLGAGKTEGGSRIEEDTQEVVKMRMNEKHLQSVKKMQQMRGDNMPEVEEGNYLSGRQSRMFTGSSTNKDQVKKKRARRKRRRRKKMMKLPDLREILQKHIIKGKSNNNKDPTKPIDVSSIDDHIVITVKDYDKKSINQVLESKEHKVGVVVLVNGKPAMIKRPKIIP